MGYTKKDPKTGRFLKGGKITHDPPVKKGDVVGPRKKPSRKKNDRRKTREKTEAEKKKLAKLAPKNLKKASEARKKLNEERKRILREAKSWNEAKEMCRKRSGHLSDGEELLAKKRWLTNLDAVGGWGREYRDRWLYHKGHSKQMTRLEKHVKSLPDEEIPVAGPKPAPPAERAPPEIRPDEVIRAELLIEAAKYKKEHRREFPPEFYDWQIEFCNALERQVLLMAGNRTGKTFTAGYVMACHLVQDYPDWWEGPRFKRPAVAIAAGVDNAQLRRVVQRELFGEVQDRQFQGGWVHKDEIREVVWNPVVPGLAMEVKINGRYGTSNVSLRAYTQAKTGTKTLTFAGTSIDLAWIDECPPDELVGQLTVRTATGRGGEGGLIYYTMTPELGVTELINTFTNDPGPDQRMIGPVSWDRCPHLTPDVIESVLAGIPEHEKDMRQKGIPFFGSGLVYAVSEARIMIDPFPIPDHFRTIRAFDLGTRHPTAIAWLAYDTEQDTIYLVKDYASTGQPAAVHAAAANSLWPDSPVVFPPDVDTTERGSGQTIRYYYEQAGMRRTLDFKNPDGSRSVEPGILDLQERMRDGRFRAFSTCQQFLKERRLYHRDEKGRIVKKNDDLLDAVRYGSQMLRYAVPQGSSYRRKPTVKRAMARRGF